MSTAANALSTARGESMLLTYLRLFGATTIWAVTFHVGHYVSQHADPLGVAFLRFIVAGATLVAIASFRKQSLRLTRTQWPLAVALAVPGVVAYTLFFLASVQTISGSRAALIAAANPIVVELAAIVAMGVNASRARWIGITLALFGTALVIARGNVLSISATIGRGELYALGGMVSWAAHTFLSRRITAVGLNSLTATTWSVIFGAGMLAIPVALSGDPERLLHYSPAVWAGIVHMAWLATAVAFILFADGIRVVGPTRAAVFTNVVPVLAVLIGVVALGDHLHWSMAAGGALVITGVWVTNRREAGLPPIHSPKGIIPNEATC